MIDRIIVLIFFCIGLFVIFNSDSSLEHQKFSIYGQDFFMPIDNASQSVVGISVINQEDNNTLKWQLKDGIFSPYINESNSIKSLGSGLIYSNDGYIVTNTHVIENASEIFVTLPGGQKFSAIIIGYDTLTDLALLKIDANNLKTSNLGNSDDLKIGEWVIALGNPLGLFDLSYQSTATRGIISGLNIDFGLQSHDYIYRDMIQTDAAINTGNSGGPLVNSLGEVVGINTFIFRDSEFNRSSTGIGFAIPINYAKRVAKELKLTGEIDRNYYIGFLGSPLDRRLANYLDIPFVKGVIINQVFKSSPAEKAGLRLSDIILSCNGVEVKEANDIFKIIHENDIRAGEIVRLKIFRKGRYKNIKMKIERFN